MKRVKARHPDLFAKTKKRNFLALTVVLLKLEYDLIELVSKGSGPLRFVEINRQTWQNEYKPLA